MSGVTEMTVHAVHADGVLVLDIRWLDLGTEKSTGIIRSKDHSV